METQLLKSEVLLKLIFCAEQKENEDEIIDEVLHAYLRKLNCFMVCILKKSESELIEKKLLPYTFKKDPTWQLLKVYILESEKKSNKGFFELVHNDFYYYIYDLTDYGYLVIGRKSSFDNYFKNEFRLVINLLSKILSQSIEVVRRKQVEKKLADEQRLLRTIIDNIPINIYTKDLQYRKTLANATELKHLGKSAESEVIGKTDTELYNDSIGKNTLIEDKKVMVDGESILAEERHVSKGRWALVSKLPIKEDDGSITGMVGISVDFTEQKKSKDQTLLFLKLLDNSSDAVQVTLETGELFYVNKIASERLGIDPRNTKNYIVTDYVNNFETLEDWRKHVEELKKTDFISLEGININQKTGNKFPVDVKVKYVVVNGIGYIIANSRDITERKLAEDTIRQQLKMQDILIRISTIYININLDKVEEVIQNSLKELAEFVGADRAYIFDYDLTNNTTTNTYEWCSDGILPEIDLLKKMPLEELPYFFGKHQKSEELCINDVNDLTENGLGSLKAGLEEQDIKSLISIPMISSGKLIGFVGFDSMKQKHFYTDKEKNLLKVFSQMLVNITERKRSESFLILQEEKYRNIISNMNLGIIEVDLDENIIYANQSFSTISGYSVDELLSMNTAEFLLSPDDNNVLADKFKLREKGISSSYELIVKNKLGEQRWWLISGAPNYNDNHELIGSIGIHLDITEQKILEKELEKALKKAEQATKAQEMFLANMSHEIRTPLNVITGMVRELSKENLTDLQRDYVKHSETSTLHLLTIVNNILDMSKIQAGEFELDVREFSIASVATDVNSILHSRASDKKLNFILKISPEIKPALIGDPGRLRQILINLMGNSIKFTDSGFVDLNVKVLKTTQDYQRILFEVIDSGIGMSEEFLVKLFDKFTQEEASSNRRFEGSGLGMSITKELVNLMGGTIEAKSQKGIGTQIRFEINLPIGDDAKLVVKNIKISKNSFEGINILLVEDNEMNRFIAIQSLKITGCQITEAINGLEAIEKLKESSFDIILMDIQMPQMNGVEATKIIRTEIDNKIPIIALTANAFKTDIDLYLSIGMTDYLIKPYKEEDLYRVVQKYVKKQITKTKLYDIEQLLQISQGDTNFVQNMLDLFAKLAKEAIVKLNESQKNNDFESIHKIAHKIKPNIDNLKIVKLIEPIRQLEKYNPAEHSKSDLKNLIEVVIVVLENVINEINK